MRRRRVVARAGPCSRTNNECSTTRTCSAGSPNSSSSALPRACGTGTERPILMLTSMHNRQAFRGEKPRFFPAGTKQLMGWPLKWPQSISADRQVQLTRGRFRPPVAYLAHSARLGRPADDFAAQVVHEPAVPAVDIVLAHGGEHLLVPLPTIFQRHVQRRLAGQR